MEGTGRSAAGSRKESTFGCVQSAVEIWRAATPYLPVYGRVIAGERLQLATASNKHEGSTQAILRWLLEIAGIRK